MVHHWWFTLVCLGLSLLSAHRREFLEFNKYRTDTNGYEIADKILNEYQTFATAIRQAGNWQGGVGIYPILISKTGSPFFHSTWQSLSGLTYFSANGGADGAHRQKKNACTNAITYFRS
eukprot:scaffold669877_cov61-Prasinocladus_malaysianus.AAC.1